MGANDWALAVYCQQCGKIQIHEMSYFEPLDQKKVLFCSCNCLQATVVRTAKRGFEIEIPCVVCNFGHKEFFNPKSLVKTKADKIYCGKDHFELGYIGKKQKIEEILAFNKRRFALLNHEQDEELIENQQVLLDVLNRLHDMAESGQIICQCGGKAMVADIIGNSVVLECCRCGSYYVAPAKTPLDLEKLNKKSSIELLQGRFLIEHIDLD